MTDKVQKIKKFLIGIAGAACCDAKTKKNIETIILPFVDSLQEEPVSGDFEEALANEWNAYNDRGAATVDALEDNTQELAFAKGFYRGAKWGKNQAKTEIQAQSMALAHGCPKEPVSEDLEEAADCYKDIVTPEDVDDYEHAYFYETYTEYQIADAFKAGAKWKEEQLEKNRLEHYDAQTEEEKQREYDFVMGIIKNEHRIPTFDDAIKHGMRLQKEKMMAKAYNGEVVATSDNGWESIRVYKKKEHSCEQKVKVIVIKED